MLPGIGSKESLILIVHTAFLVVRTFLSIYVAHLDGTIVKALVDRNATHFMWNLIKWLGVAIPATYVNSMIRFLESKLSIAFRTRFVFIFFVLFSLLNNLWFLLILEWLIMFIPCT